LKESADEFCRGRGKRGGRWLTALVVTLGIALFLLRWGGEGEGEQSNEDGEDEFHVEGWLV
jgi:hypothetical protein